MKYLDKWDSTRLPTNSWSIILIVVTDLKELLKVTSIQVNYISDNIFQHVEARACRHGYYSPLTAKRVLALSLR